MKYSGRVQKLTLYWKMNCNSWLRQEFLPDNASPSAGHKADLFSMAVGVPRLHGVVMPSIGQQVIDAIIAGKLVWAECPDYPESNCVMIWSANVYEQIDQIVMNYDPAVEHGESPVIHFTRASRPFDRIHDIVSGYGRILFPWRGRWLMLTERWCLRWTDCRGFHNCTATGIR